jgi:hypothetical protein
MSTIQITFILGRFILDGEVLLHVAHKSKASGVICKLDIEKTYDNMDTNFLQELFIIIGFHEKITKWVMSVLNDGTTTILINDQMCLTR